MTALGVHIAGRASVESATGHPSSWRPTPREFDWPQIAETAPTLAATLCRYLDQIALSLQPSSVRATDGILRRFAGYLSVNHPEVVGLADIERRHIEAFKRYLPTRPGRNGRPPLSPSTIRMSLGVIRTCFERVSEWDYPDAPTRVLVFNGDLPTPDDPLPKFLTDPDAAKLMRAAAEDHPGRRLVIEMLIRSGVRVGELCALPADAVTFINGRHWLRVPVGKLHNDRYVPLHPQLVELLESHRASRDDDIDRLVIWNGGPLDRHQIARMLNRVARHAGIDHVQCSAGPAIGRTPDTHPPTDDQPPPPAHSTRSETRQHTASNARQHALSLSPPDGPRSRAYHADCCAPPAR